VIGRLLCQMGLHQWWGTDVPHTYRCLRPGCPAVTAGHS